MITRLSLDIGTSSIGWALLEIDEEGEIVAIVRSGVRIFSTGSTGLKKDVSLNVERRLARSERRRRDRYLQRRRTLMLKLREISLWPDGNDKEGRRILNRLQVCDPYQLRALAASNTDQLHQLAQKKNLDPLHLIGRAFFHMNQRRGFKSNFRAKDKDEKGKVESSINDTIKQMEEEGVSTFGQLLWLYRNKKKLPVRARVRVKDENDDKNLAYYTNYPSRELIDKEFETIWENQKKQQGGIFTDKNNKKNIRDVIFLQRNLKAPIVGRCVFYPKYKRAPRALPSFQYFRALQTINNLCMWDDNNQSISFSFDQDKQEDWERIKHARKDILNKLLKKKYVKFDELRKIIKLQGIVEGNVTFNFESKDNKTLRGSDISGLFTSKQKEGKESKNLRKLIQEWEYPKFDQFILVLLKAKNDDEAIQKLSDPNGNWKLSETQAKLSLNLHEHLPQGYGQLSVKALIKLIPLMKDGIPYDKAATLTFGEHTRKRGPGNKKYLPRYQQAIREYCHPLQKQDEDKPDNWRIPNPTVHVGLNQLRLVVNDIIRIHGKPTEIVVELARDLLNKKQRKDLDKERKKREEENKRLDNILKEFNCTPNAYWRKLIRVWYEQGLPNNRRCVFCTEQRSQNGNWPEKPCVFCPKAKKKDDGTEKSLKQGIPRCPYCITKGSGKNISITDLLSGGKFQLEHILPRSRTFDNTLNNFVIACRSCNDEKNNRTPYEWLKSDQTRYNAVLDYAKANMPGKFWRFDKNAMEIWENKRGFMGRQLAETRYLSRAVLRYLEEICPYNKIVATTGVITALLRRFWGLNSLLHAEGKNLKNRSDHRHHVIDAIVIGTIGGGLNKKFVKRLVTSAKRAEEARIDELIDRAPKPAPRIQEDYRSIVNKAINNFFVSYKPNHKKISGQYFKESAYGIMSKDGKKFLTRYVPLVQLEYENVFPKTAKKKAIADKNIADLFRKRITNKENFESERNQLALDLNMRRIQLKEPEEPVTLIRNYAGKEYKALKSAGNLSLRIYSINEKWFGHNITFLDMAPGTKKKTDLYKGASLVMELRHRDMLALMNPTEEDIHKLNSYLEKYSVLRAKKEHKSVNNNYYENIIVCTVSSFSNTHLYVREHNLSQSDHLSIRIGSLKKRNPRKLRISSSGLICFEDTGKSIWQAES